MTSSPPIQATGSREGERHRWRAAEVVSRAIEVLRDEGCVSLWFKVLGELGYRRMEVTLDWLDRDLDVRLRDIPVVSSFLNESEIDECAKDLPDISRDEIRSRLDAGELCSIARVEGQMVSRRWYVTERAYVPYLDLEVELDDGVVYGYDVLVRSDFRRRGISTIHLMQSRRLLRAAGMRARFTLVMPENSAGRGLTRSSGIASVGHLRSLRAGRYRRAWFSAERGVDTAGAFQVPSRVAPF